MTRLAIVALAGLVAQLIDGALGMAYGVTATTLLVSSGTAAASASATVHLAEIGTTLVSGTSHWRFGNVSWRTVRWIALPGAVGAFAGAVILGESDGQWTAVAVSAILLALGAYIVVRFGLGLRPQAVRETRLRGRWLAPLGLGAGFVDAIGGGGWGPITTPTLMTAGKMEPRTAVGSASASEFLVAIAASVGFLYSLGTSGVDLAAAAALLAGGALAAPLAAWAVKHLPAPVMGTFVGGLILITNARTLMLSAGWDGDVRLAVLLAIAAATGVLVSRRAVAAYQEDREPEPEPALVSR
jgi:uncharacterized membrane protein YfcA